MYNTYTIYIYMYISIIFKIVPTPKIFAYINSRYDTVLPIDEECVLHGKGFNNRNQWIKVNNLGKAMCQKHNIYQNNEMGYCATHQHKNMSFISGGTYLVGNDSPLFIEDGEFPERLVTIDDFYIDKYEVSNEQFGKFVIATNYTTDAEKYGNSFLFETLLNSNDQKRFKNFRVAGAPWWYNVQGANWQHPNGPNSNLLGLEAHPVVHVSWKDALLFCEWMEKRLPTENEWEVACRGGKKGRLFPWGNKLMPKNQHRLNIWQGEFPYKNTVEDGFVTTCPINIFLQNSYGLYNIVGNVWEWTGDLWNISDKNINAERVKKGGSYLCHKSFCYRYRCAARYKNTANSSAGNVGFRCAKNVT